MKNPLNKRLLRDLKHNKGRYIAISIMLIVIISSLSGFLATADSVMKSFKNNRVECKVEDGLFKTNSKITQEIKEGLLSLGVQVYENFYTNQDILTESKIRIYKDREKINLATIMEGSAPKNKNEIMLERLFAENNKLNVGDFIEVKGKKYKITGTFAVPDYSSLFEKNSNLIMETIHFGIAIVTEDVLNEDFNEDLEFNYSYYFKERNLSKNEKRDKVASIKEEIIKNNILLNDFCTAEENQSISFVENDMGSDVPMMKVFCYILIAVLAFVFSVIIINIIEDEAPIIGTLLANGYSKFEILSYYLKLPTMVSVVSAVIGNLLGYLVFPKEFKNLYYRNYSLPPSKIEMNFEALMLTTVIPLGIMIIINIVIISKKLSLSPLKFLRKDLKRHSNRKAIKLPNVSFIKRFRIRVILQNRASYFMLFVGIFIGSLILLYGLCIKPIINKYIDDINKSCIANYEYILKTPEKVEGDAEEFTTINLKTYYKLADKDLDISFFGVKENSKFLKNNKIETKEKEIYISNNLMKKLKVNIGDNINFKNSYTGDEYTLKIVGSYEYSAGLAVFMSKEELNKLLGYDSNYFNGYFSNEKLEIEKENQLTVIIPEDMTKLGNQMLLSFGEINIVCIIVAVLVYISLMYIMIKIVMDKNALYMSYMKVFGYDDEEIRKLYLNSTTIVVILSLIIGLPLEEYSAKACMDIAFVKTSGYLEIVIPSYVYILIIIIGVFSYALINYMNVKRIKKISMTEALKSRE
ncbi:MAG: ABC transporter permease [Clostridium sp.]|nr:ABC transporter permease [Clostridium sp.]